MCCPAYKALSQAKLLYVIGRLSVELPPDVTMGMKQEAAKIITEIDNALNAKCYQCWLRRLFGKRC